MIFAQVVIDSKTKALNRAFTYHVPEDLEDKIEVGQAVLVLFNNRNTIGFVTKILKDKTRSNFDFNINEIKQIVSKSYFNQEKADIFEWIAHKYIAPLSTCVKLGLPYNSTPKILSERGEELKISKPVVEPKSYKFKQNKVKSYLSTYKKPKSLTYEQDKALKICLDAYKNHQFNTILIDGVTGSGKTEIYLQLIEKVIEHNQNAIVLVPEIALTPQTVARFVSRFGDVVAILHSKMTPAQKREQWFWINEGNAKIVIGPRSALFAPLENVGVVIIDEEHETTYKQESSPRYRAHDVAKQIITKNSGLLVLGSATPSIESLYDAKHNPYSKRVELTKRASGAKMPSVQIVDMSQVDQYYNQSQFSLLLKNKIIKTIKSKKKIVLLLNSRGYSSFLQCRECGFVPECINCSTSLNFHSRTNMLMCHHCGYSIKCPARCPKCNSPYLKRMGSGTERVEDELRSILDTNNLENIPIIRMDSDTTAKRGSHEKLLEEFGESESSILIGTQMVAKGLDFSDVSLVGVVNADISLHLPDFRAEERTFDLLEQVSGRCGRGKERGEVIIQTLSPQSSAIRATQAHDRELFLRVELPKRKVLKYPPYVKLINVLIWSKNENTLDEAATKIHQKIHDSLAGKIEMGVSISDVVKCPIAKISGNFRKHIIIKCPLDIDISQEIESTIRRLNGMKNVNVAIDVDAYQLL